MATDSSSPWPEELPWEVATDITEENLEDFLAYDDLFLDYFNAFLALPVFPQPLYYNRLTGTFLEVEGIINPLSGELTGPASPPYGATDEERDRMLEWARDERLPLFLRTNLFREFKLCKLLLRPLDDRYSASRGSSRLIRGYSRQTESYVSSLSNSADNSANYVDLEDGYGTWAGMRRSALYRYRPGSRAYSLPARLGPVRSMTFSSVGETQQVLSKDISDSTKDRPQASRSAASRPTHSKEVSNVSVLSNRRSQISKEISNLSNEKSQAARSLASRRLSSKEISNLTNEKLADSEFAEKSDEQSDVGEDNFDTVPDTPAKKSSKDGSQLVKDVTFTKEDTIVCIDDDGALIGEQSVPSDKTSRRSTRAELTRPRRGSSRAGLVRSRNRPDSQESSSRKKGTDTKTEDDDLEIEADFDQTFGEPEPAQSRETYVAFADAVSDAQTETDVKNLEGKHKMTLQHIKEEVLGLVEGMEQFKAFLYGTVGMDLLNFWLDCEHFKDTMEDCDEAEALVTRNRLFRDIQDKYKMTLTDDAKRQMANAANHSGVSHTIFIRTQYDILRRLRAYWVPRFLIHKERVNELSFDLDDPTVEEQFTERPTTASCLFPSISLVNSLPIRPDDIMEITKSTSWDSVIQGGKRLDERVKSAKPNTRPVITGSTLKEKLITALAADNLAGGPFRMFLERRQDEELLNNLHFWEDVMEYGAVDNKSSDRLLRMCNAWAIYNKYISADAVHSIGLNPQQRDTIYQNLLKNKNFVDSLVFDSAGQSASELMEKAWIRYLKEDLKAFIDCHIRSTQTPPSTAEDIEVYWDECPGMFGGGRLVVRRPRPWVKRYPSSTGTERGRRLRTALSLAESIDEARKAEQKRKAKAKRKMMEKERRKAVRAARQRQREAKQTGKRVSFKRPETREDKDYSDYTDIGNIPEEEPVSPPTFKESANNKGILNMYKKYVSETESKEVMNALSLYLDVDAYNGFGDGKQSKQKKDIQANYIHKTYLEKEARKKVLVSDKAYNRMRSEKDRPKSPTLKEVQNYILPQLEDNFKKFWEIQAEELGLDNKSMANMSKVELAMRSEDPSIITNWQKKRGRAGKDTSASDSSDYARKTKDTHAYKIIPPSPLKYGKSRNKWRPFDKSKPKAPPGSDVSNPPRGNRKNTKEKQAEEASPETQPESRRRKKPDGRAQPTREDKVELLMQLNNAATGNLPVQMIQFYKYLVNHGEDDGMPNVDKDLFFYCEVQKFKECSHSHSDEELLKRKVQSLMDSYVETSAVPNLQIDISTEVQQKTIRASQRYLSGKDVSQSIFDEAQYCVFKELLPYWAGFSKVYQPPPPVEPKRPRKRLPVIVIEPAPATRQERERKKRLKEVLDWKPPPAKGFKLPSLPKGVAATAISFTLIEGIKWREGEYMMDKDEEVLPEIKNISRLSGKSTVYSDSTCDLLYAPVPLRLTYELLPGKSGVEFSAKIKNQSSDTKLSLQYKPAKLAPGETDDGEISGLFNRNTPRRSSIVSNSSGVAVRGRRTSIVSGPTAGLP